MADVHQIVLLINLPCRNTVKTSPFINVTRRRLKRYNCHHISYILWLHFPASILLQKEYTTDYQILNQKVKKKKEKL